MHRLERLHLAGVKVDDTLFTYLPQPSPMHSLYLDGTDLTNRGMPPLARLVGLQELHLENTAITDIGLTSLRPLRQLRFLYLQGAKVTPTGISQLRPFLRGCTILLE